MPFTGTTFLSLRGQLSERLNDTGKVFSTDAELALHIQDAIRFWNILTGDNKINYALALTAGTVWYDLQTIGLSGTRIQSVGGSRILKWQFALPGFAPFDVIHLTGTFYNNGVKPVVIGVGISPNNFLVSAVIQPGVFTSVNLSVNAPGAGSFNYTIGTQIIADPVDVVAINPFVENQTQFPGVNIIPSTGLNFTTGWTAGVGAIVTLAQKFLAPFSSPQFCVLQDQDIYTRITYALLEPPSAIAAVSTAQFAQDEIIQSVQRKRDEFISRTGCRSTIQNLPVVANVSTVQLPSTVIQVRRGYWLPTDNLLPFPLFDTDEFAISAFQPFAPNTPGQPIAYSSGVRPPLQVEIVPASAVDGNIEFVVHESQSALSAAQATTILIPNDFIPGLMWGAIADLFSFNLLGKDAVRAEIARQRFEELVALNDTYPFIFGARVNNTAVMVDAVEQLDLYQPGWRAINSNPPFVGTSGNNLVAFPGNAAATITLLMLASANVPVNDNDQVQLGDEVLDVILDEAQATASFKMGGDEAANAHQLHGNIIRLAADRNAVVRALSCFRDVLYGRVKREDQIAPMKVTYDDNQ